MKQHGTIQYIPSQWSFRGREHLGLTQLWPESAALLGTETQGWPSAISQHCQVPWACPWLAAVSTKHLVRHGQSIQDILSGTPGGWAKMFQDLRANTLNGLALRRGQSLSKATPNTR